MTTVHGGELKTHARSRVFRRRICVGLAVLSCLAVFTGCHTPATTGRRYDAAIERYVSFAREQKTGPVDYIMDLFKDHDVVILCERTHPETTQWDMIYRLTTDERFIRDVGVVFTEYGSVSSQSAIDKYLTAPGLTGRDAREKLLRIYRNISPIWPLWDNTNFYDYLRRLRERNVKLAPDEKVRVYFCDMPWDWDTATSNDLIQAWRGPIVERDRGMAERIISERRRRLAAGEPDKCLVVMNYRHAFRPMRYQNGQPADNTGSYLFEAFPDRTANVLINTVCPVEVRSDSDISDDLVHDGMWDAAFSVTGNRDLGFDFRGSPFGADSFDLYRFDPAIAALRYEDVFDGFVFFKPIAEHRYVHGAPGLLNEAFVRELRRRFALAVGTTVAERFSSSNDAFEFVVERARKRGVALENISNVMDRRSNPAYFNRYVDRMEAWTGKGGSRR
jgi:hypothetical protein